MVEVLKRRIKDASLRQRISTVWGGSETDQEFTFRYVYTDTGMVTAMTYPDGSVHEFSYDAALNRLAEIREGATPFVTGLQYTTAGVVTRMDYGNGAYQQWSFDNRKRVSQITIGNKAEVLEDLVYRINDVGDITAINDNEYRYDAFNRITGANTMLPGKIDHMKMMIKYFGTYKTGGQVRGVSYNSVADLNDDGRVNGEDHLMAALEEITDTYDVENFSYDKNGNRTKLAQNGDEFTYVYGVRNRLERVDVKRKGQTVIKTFARYEYDANGNTTKRTLINIEGIGKATSFEYDTMNRLVKTIDSSGESLYYYDNAGNRFIPI